MKFKKWFNELRKEKFPGLWDQTFETIDCYSHDYENDITYLKENGDKYISFLENQIEFMFNELMKLSKKGVTESNFENFLEDILPIGLKSFKNIDKIKAKAKEKGYI